MDRAKFTLADKNHAGGDTMKQLNILVLSIMLILLSGCLTAPEREAFEYGACYDTALCRYYSAKGDNPIDCSKDAETCQKMRTLQDCKKASGEIDGLTFQGCWDKLR